MEDELEMYIKHDREEINRILEMARRQKTTTGYVDYNDPFADDILRKSLIRQWGKENAEHVKNVVRPEPPKPKEHKKVCIRDLLLVGVRINHEKGEITLSFVHRVNREKKIKVKLSSKSPLVKNLKYSEVFDISGDVKVGVEGKKIEFTRVAKIVSL